MVFPAPARPRMKIRPNIGSGATNVSERTILTPDWENVSFSP